MYAAGASEPTRTGAASRTSVRPWQQPAKRHASPEPQRLRSQSIWRRSVTRTRVRLTSQCASIARVYVHGQPILIRMQVTRGQVRCQCRTARRRFLARHCRTQAPHRRQNGICVARSVAALPQAVARRETRNASPQRTRPQLSRQEQDSSAAAAAAAAAARVRERAAARSALVGRPEPAQRPRDGRSEIRGRRVSSVARVPLRSRRPRVRQGAIFDHATTAIADCYLYCAVRAACLRRGHAFGHSCNGCPRDETFPLFDAKPVRTSISSQSARTN